MKKSLFLTTMFGLLLLAACKKDKPQDVPPQFIDPADANALSQVLIMPAGTQTSQGSAPAPSSNPSAPVVNANNTEITSSNGSTSPLGFTYSGVNGNLGGCYVQVDGAGSYFTIPYNSNSGSSGQLAVPLGIPTNVLAGQFCVTFTVYDVAGRISNVVTTCVNVLRLGTGALQISLSWNTATDQDLRVTDPSGTEIYYGNETSSTGGQLDRDDLDGFGPENIYWLENAPDGTYQVRVNDYEDTSTPNTFYVTVNAPGKTKSFSGTTANGSTVDVVTIVKSGTNYSF